MKFHINPETGKTGQCTAKLGNCRFGASTLHFATREEAQKHFELSMENNTFEDKIKNIVKQREKLSLKLEKAWDEIPGKFGGVSYKRNIPKNEYDSINEKLYILGKEQDALREQNRTVPLAEWNTNPDMLGLKNAQEDLIEQINLAAYTTGDKSNDYLYSDENIREHLNNTMKRYAAGEKPEKGIMTPGNRLLAALTDENNSEHNQIYCAFVFPDKDLNPVLNRLGVNNVSVASFYNSREWGLAYTVMTPEGNTRSFSIYEHRNTDSLIINGVTNWSREKTPYGPYWDEGRSRDFFAEYSGQDKKQAAETLAFYLKSSQDGSLETDEELRAKAERLDWVSILSERMPGFKQWAEENNIQSPKRWFEE